MLFHSSILLSSVEREFQHDPDALKVIISHVCIWRVLGNRCCNIFIFYFDKNKNHPVLVFCLFSGPDWTFVLTRFMWGIFTRKYVRNLSSDKENFCELLTSYILWKYHRIPGWVRMPIRLSPLDMTERTCETGDVCYNRSSELFWDTSVKLLSICLDFCFFIYKVGMKR